MVAPAPNPAQRFDGIWVGTYVCGQGGPRGSLQPFQMPRAAEIKNGHFELMSSVGPGVPGHWSVTGTVAPDGSFDLAGESISNGNPPGAPATGERHQHRFNGHVQGDQLAAADLPNAGRGCQISLTRRH